MDNDQTKTNENNIADTQHPPESNMLSEKLARIEEESARNLDNWKRAEAALANYHKDELKRAEATRRFAREQLIEEILEALDDLQVTVKHVPKEVVRGYSSWYSGLVQTFKNFDDFFKKNNVERIEAENCDFDPELHEAIETAEEDGVAPGKILQEYRSGYKIDGRVIRPARVKVSK